jgi:HlyD family secretion protein
MSTRSATGRGLALLAEERPVEAFEQLDAAVRVVQPPHWLMLGALFGALGGAVVFSCLYRAPVKVGGRGILVARAGAGGEPFMQVTAPAAGRLTRVDVAIGSDVRAGQVIAQIDRDDLRDQIKTVEAELARLRDEDAALSRFDAVEEATRAEALGKVEQTLRRNIQFDRGRLAVSRHIAAADATLRARGFLNEGEALKSRAEADAIESTIGGIQARLFEMNYTRVQDRTGRRREKLKRGLALRDAETRLAVLRGRLERESKVVSAYAGRVVDLMITPHAPIERGEPAALLRPVGDGGVASLDPREAIVFVPAGVGKRVRVGDPVEVSPDTVRRPEHGFVRGEVRDVSEIPATEMAMMAELKHPALVESFVEQYGGQALLSVHVRLIPAPPGDPSDYRVRSNRLLWSSSTGAYQRVSPGTLCAAEVVVETRPLISLAMPWVKELAGLD